MTLGVNKNELDDKFLSDQANAVQNRIKQLAPSFTFEELWQLHRQTDSKSTRKGMLVLKAAVICMLLLFSGSMIFPSVGVALKKIFFIELLYEKTGGFGNGLSQIEQKNLSISTDLSVTDKDIKFTINEIFYDGIQIVVSYEVEFLKKKERISEEDAVVFYDLKIEGDRATMMSTHAFTVTGDHTFVGTTIINTSPLPEHPKLYMHISRVGNTDGVWNVSIPLSMEKTSPLIKTFRPLISASVGNKKFTVEKIISTPVTTQLLIKTEYTGELFYTLKDDKGVPFDPAGGGMGGGGEELVNFGPPSAANPKPQYVTLIVKESNESTEVKIPLEW
jgi:hypothetical protein